MAEAAEAKQAAEPAPAPAPGAAESKGDTAESNAEGVVEQQAGKQEEGVVDSHPKLPADFFYAKKSVQLPLLPLELPRANAALQGLMGFDFGKMNNITAIGESTVLSAAGNVVQMLGACIGCVVLCVVLYCTAAHPQRTASCLSLTPPCCAVCLLADIITGKVRYLYGNDGRGIGAIAVHPTKPLFAVAEKGDNPNVCVHVAWVWCPALLFHA